MNLPEPIWKKYKMRFLFIIFVFLSLPSFGQEKGIYFKTIELDQNGFLKWSVENEKQNTRYQIQDFRWNKWLLVEEIAGKGIGNNEYSLQLDTTCGLYKIRIKAVDSAYQCSESLEFKNPKLVNISNRRIVDSKNNFIEFSVNTEFEIYDMYGNIKKKGCGKQADFTGLSIGLYYLMYGNEVKEIIKEK